MVEWSSIRQAELGEAWDRAKRIEPPGKIVPLERSGYDGRYPLSRYVRRSGIIPDRPSPIKPRAVPPVECLEANKWGMELSHAHYQGHRPPRI